MDVWQCALILLLLLLPCIATRQSDLFSSNKHIEWLLDVEKGLAGSLQTYIKNEKKRLWLAQQYLLKSAKARSTDAELTEEVVGHPLKAIELMRRMTRDWRRIDKAARRDTSSGVIGMLAKAREAFPSEEDFSGAQDALLRLQSTYQLSASTISSGIVPGASNLSKMDAGDAFDIGKKAYDSNDFKTTTVWMGEALRLIDSGQHQSSLPDVGNVLDYLAWSEYMVGNVKQALDATLRLLTIEPGNQRILANKVEFNAALERKGKDMRNKMTNKTAANVYKKKPFKYEKFTKSHYDDPSNGRLYNVEKETAKSLCRGEVEAIPKSMVPRLICWLKQSNPLFILKPAKVERIYDDPEILFYRQIISSREIATIQQIATPLLKRATVHNPVTGLLEFVSYRISKSAWLHGAAHSVVESLNKRIAAFSGLDLETAEMLQVANYGIGGHYDTHFDFSRLKKEMMSELQKKDGNRCATFLTYMSDVEMGGGTVFTNIGQMVKPSKGDGIFWYNLKRDGSGDYRTRHAACPVLVGNKWIANKWIHEHGQELRRPCKLNPNL